MARKMKRRLAAGAGAALAVAGGGAAIAATQLSPKAESEAVVNDAAKQLGVDPAKLSDALKQALANRVDAAVAAGTMTKEQGDELKARIASGDFPLFGGRGPGFGHGPGGPHGGFGAHLSAAATYLGVTEAALRTSLEGGKTLADIAKEKGKSDIRAGRRARGGRDEGARRGGRGRKADEGPARRARRERKAAVPGPRRREGTRPAAPSAGMTASASAAARPAPTPATASMEERTPPPPAA